MPENPNASRTWATFRISGKRLDPERITQLLKLAPSESFKAGDPRGTTSLRWSHGYWGISSEGLIESTDLEVHLEWLASQLLPVRNKLVEVRAASDIVADIFCYWESATGNGGPSFSPKLMERIAMLDLELSLDIYFASSAMSFYTPLLEAE
jgi:Domain of unknown function (DUF4279)